MLELLLGQVPEAIYFALFMIFVKGLKQKRILFVALMIMEYILLMHTFPYSIYSHVGYFVTTYLSLKILYHEKAQITDVFTLGIASISIMLFNVIVSPLFSINYILAVVIIRIMMFAFILIMNTKLYAIQKLYKKIWNRKPKTDIRIKSLTFRSINLIVFNIMFYSINLGMLFALYKMYVKF